MRWFARGKLWSSPEEARAENVRRAEAADTAARDRSWRPGGSHRDPRQPYKDAKKKQNQDRRQRRFEYRGKADQGGALNKRSGGPGDDRPSDARPPRKDWSRAPASDRRESKPWNDRPKPAGRWPGAQPQGGADKGGGWNRRPDARRPDGHRPGPGDDRGSATRPPKKEWAGAPAPGRREFKPWNDRPKPAGRWPGAKPQGGSGGGPREPSARGDGPPRKAWSNQARPEQRERPPFRGARPPSGRPAQPRSGDRPPFRGPGDGGSKGDGPRNKGPRGPKR